MYVPRNLYIEYQLSLIQTGPSNGKLVLERNFVLLKCYCLMIAKDRHNSRYALLLHMLGDISLWNKLVAPLVVQCFTWWSHSNIQGLSKPVFYVLQSAIEKALLNELDVCTCPIDVGLLSEKVTEETKITHNLTTITECLLKFEAQTLILWVCCQLRW